MEFKNSYGNPGSIFSGWRRNVPLQTSVYHELVPGLSRFGTYVRRCIAEGKLEEYPAEYRGKQHIIHFSAAIWIGFIIALEVAY